MAKHRATIDWRTTLLREIWWLKNQWYCFVKPSIRKSIQHKTIIIKKYWRN